MSIITIAIYFFIYLFIGRLWLSLVMRVLKKKTGETDMSTPEIIFQMFFWPIALLFSLYYFIEELRNIQ